MNKLQRSFPLSSLIWAAIVTAIVLALAASASAQEDTATSNSPQEPALDNARPLTNVAPLMPRASSTNPSESVMRPGSTSPAMMNANGAAMQARMDMMVERKAKFEEKRATLLQDLEERRENIMEKRALIASSSMERRAKLDEAARERIENRATKLTTVVGNAITQLESMSAKLREHATKLSSTGIDSSGVTTLLDESDRVLKEAREALEGVDTNVSYATLSEKPKEDWNDAKEQFMTVRGLLGDVRELLHEALRTLKDLRPAPTIEPANQ